MRHRLLHLCLLVAALGAFATPAFANNDIVQFGSNIHVESGSSVHDAVCFFCSVDAEGPIEGDVVVFFGSIHIAKAADKDVVNFFGSISADDNVSIGKDMVSMFGNIHLGDNVSIGKDMVAMFGGVHAGQNVSIGGDRVVQPAWLFWAPLLLFVAVIYLIVHELTSRRRRRAYMRGYPMPPR